jgi:hypothetical protein
MIKGHYGTKAQVFQFQKFHKIATIRSSNNKRNYIIMLSVIFLMPERIEREIRGQGNTYVL